MKKQKKRGQSTAEGDLETRANTFVFSSLFFFFHEQAHVWFSQKAIHHRNTSTSLSASAVFFSFLFCCCFFFFNKQNSLAEETKRDTCGRGKTRVYTDTDFLFYPPKGPITEGLWLGSPVLMWSVHLLLKDILCCDLLHHNFMNSPFSNCIVLKSFVFSLGLTDESPHVGEEKQPLLAFRCARRAFIARLRQYPQQ